jgi:hypothetical protein
MKGHEQSDFPVRWIPWILVAAVGVGVVIFAGVWVLYRFYERLDQSQDVRRSLVEQPSPIPPEPRLQVDPQEELQRFRQSQMELLNSYGWVSKEEKRVRIPIERAMEVVAENAGRTSK